MATQQEVDNLIDSLIIDNTTKQVTPSAVREVLKAINARVPASSDPSVLTVSAPLALDEFTNNLSMPSASSEEGADGFLKWTDYRRFEANTSPISDGEFRLSFKGYQDNVANTGSNIELNDVCLSIKLSTETAGAAEFGYYQYVDITKSDQDPDAYLAITTNDVNAV